jgi:hypothetical protein
MAFKTETMIFVPLVSPRAEASIQTGENTPLMGHSAV